MAQEKFGQSLGANNSVGGILFYMLRAGYHSHFSVGCGGGGGRCGVNSYPSGWEDHYIQPIFNNIFNETDDQVELDNFKISSLLYADDLIILSTSKYGLQSCLNKLVSYCGDNCLTVNLKKTKIVVFCNSGKVSTDKFYFNDVQIENSNSYTYLGIVFSSSGTYKYCQEDLYKRALRTQFKLTKCFSSMTPRLNTLLHLFEHTVEPIVLYGSEIWGTVNILSSKIKKADFKFENLLENFLCEKLHIKFLKYISKMGKKSCNTAVISEFGRYPLNINVLVNTCKCFQRLLATNSELLQCTYKESCTIASHDKVSRVSCVTFLLKQLGVSDFFIPCKNKTHKSF